MAATGIVYDIMGFALHDGPGIRTTVFLKGCPMRCLWCANPESQSRDPEFIFFKDACLACGVCVDNCHNQAIRIDPQGFKQVDLGACDYCGACVEGCYPDALRLAGRPMTADAVMAEVLKDFDVYRRSGGGVTFSGGEPLFQPDFLEDCLKACRKAGLHTAVETAGLANWGIIEKITPWVDLFLYDLKMVLPEPHKKYTGAPNTIILENLKRLVACQQVIVRIPMIPEVNDRGEAWNAIFDFLEQLPWRGRIDLLPYHRLMLGKYVALNRKYKLDPSLKAEMGIVHKHQEQLERTGFHVQLYGG